MRLKGKATVRYSRHSRPKCYIDLPQANFDIRARERSFPVGLITPGNSIINLPTFRSVPLAAATDAWRSFHASDFSAARHTAPA